MKPVEISVAISPLITLKGDLYRARESSGRLAIICHGFTAFRKYLFLPYVAEEIAKAGIDALVVDFSRNGMDSDTGEFIDPENFSRNTFSNEREEAVALIQALRNEGVPSHDVSPVKEVYLIGHSRGGVTALGAASDPAVSDVIKKISVWSTPSDVNPERFGATPEMKEMWRENGEIPYAIERLGIEVPLQLEVLEEMEEDIERVERFTRALTIPLLVVHGAQDERIDASCGERIAAWGKDSSLLVVAGGDHVFNVERPMDVPSSELSEATQALLEFLRPAIH